MGGYRFDYEEKVWGGETLRLSPVHFRASRLFYALQALKNTKGSLLDVGCGVGDFPEAIKHYYPQLRVYGIDISKKAIRLAKKRVRKVVFEAADVQKLPFKDEAFDAVTCFDLLEHVEDPQKALVEIYRVIKPGGIFHTFIPTEAELISLEGALITLGWKGKEIYGGHPHHFTARVAKQLLIDSGFKIKKLFWGDHFVHQALEIIYFSWLLVRGQNVERTVEGYLATVEPDLKVNLARVIKNILATVSFCEERTLSWLPALGFHATCVKKVRSNKWEVKRNKG